MEQNDVYCEDCERKIPLIWVVPLKQYAHEKPGLSFSCCPKQIAKKKSLLPRKE